MKNKLTYFIARSSMFGIGFFLIFQNAGKDTWISILLGTILGLIILYIYNIIKNHLQNDTLQNKLKQTLIGKIYIVIMLLFYLYLTFITLMLLPLFVNSFYLTTTPKIIVNIPFLILAIYLSFKDKGKAYNPLEKKDPNLNVSIDQRTIGGLGIYMVKSMVDEISYEHLDDTNILYIKKNF